MTATLLVVTTTLLFAQDGGEPAGEKVPAVTESEAIGIGRMMSLLDEKTRIDIVKTPLKSVCQLMASKRKIQIVFDQANMKEAGIADDVLVTFAIRDVPTRESLSKMLTPLGLTYRIRPDGFLITPLPERLPPPKPVDP
jgi:hypothetical protein